MQVPPYAVTVVFSKFPEDSRGTMLTDFGKSVDYDRSLGPLQDARLVCSFRFPLWHYGLGYLDRRGCRHRKSKRALFWMFLHCHGGEREYDCAQRMGGSSLLQ